MRLDGREAPAGFNRPSISFQPSLHSLDVIFKAMMPFFGMNSPVSVIYNYNQAHEYVVRGRLGDMDQALEDAPRRGHPIVTIGG